MIIFMCREIVSTSCTCANNLRVKKSVIFNQEEFCMFWNLEARRDIHYSTSNEETWENAIRAGHGRTSGRR